MNIKLIFVEITLLLVSVIIFRGAWLLIDAQDIMHEPWALFISLVVGLLIALFCFNYIIRHRKKQQ